MDNVQSQFQPGKGKVMDLELTPDGYKIRRVCHDRFTPPEGPKDITLNLARYLPFEQLNTETYVAMNMVGWKLGNVMIKSRTVYPSYDGKRLVMEVGCNTIIYLQISPGRGAIHHRFFLQSHKEFLMDITTRAVAAHVSRAAEPIVTIAKYEMYFLMGMFSTLGLAAWIAVTGSDITVTAINLRSKGKAFGELTKVLLQELENIKKYAPTLHKKLLELIAAEKENTVNKTIKEIPKAVVTDEKAQAQLAGILYGKHVFSPKALSVWGAVITVLIQAGVKSATNVPDAYLEVIDKRYASVFRGFTNTNWYDVQERQQAVIKMVALFKEAKIPISAQEMGKIILEVQAHPKELQASLINITKAFKAFKMKVG